MSKTQHFLLLESGKNTFGQNSVMFNSSRKLVKDFNCYLIENFLRGFGITALKDFIQTWVAVKNK